MTLLDRFHAQVAATPEATALVGADTRISYRELDARADRLAATLRGHGVGPEVVVGLCLPRTPEAVIGLVGILKAGGGYLPLDAEHPAERLAYLVRAAGARLVVGHPGHGPDLPVPVLPLEASDTARSGPPGSSVRCPAPADALACVIFTSGSTGRPKGIGLRARSIENVADWALSRRPGPVVCAQFCSLGFDVSLQEIFGTLLGGGCLVTVDEERRKDPYLLVDLLAREGVERLYLSPSFLNHLAHAYLTDTARPALPRLREVIAAGEPLRIGPRVRRFLAEVGAGLENQYGPSETHQATAHRLAGPPRDWPERPSLGRPIPNVSVHVLDEVLRPVPPGRPGEVFIGGRGVARGYLGQPTRTAERFLPDPFAGRPGAVMYRTGDRARWTDRGDLEFLGRLDDQVKVRGFRVEPAEVAHVLCEDPEVGDAAVVPRQEPDGLWRLDAYVVGADPQSPPDPARVRAFVAGRLPDHLLPATVTVLGALPLNRNGKVDRQALPVPAVTARRSGVPYAAPGNDQEAVLCGLFAEVLGVPEVGVDDDFFHLGGNSLLATRLVTAVLGAFGVQLPVRAVFDRPTVRRLAPDVVAALVARISRLDADEIRAAMATVEDA